MKIMKLQMLKVHTYLSAQEPDVKNWGWGRGCVVGSELVTVVNILENFFHSHGGSSGFTTLLLS